MDLGGLVKGRKRKPTRIRKLQGNPSKRKLNTDEPEYDVAVPDAPPNLTAEALVEWTRITKLLSDQKVISKADMAIVGLYCQAYSLWDRYSQQLQDEDHLLVTPKGYKYANPLIGMMNTQAERVAKYAAELGITPASRSRVKTLTSAKQEREDKKRASLRAAFQSKSPAEELFNAKVKA